MAIAGFPAALPQVRPLALKMSLFTIVRPCTSVAISLYSLRPSLRLDLCSICNRTALRALRDLSRQDVVLCVFSLFERDQPAFLNLRRVCKSWLRVTRHMTVEWSLLKVMLAQSISLTASG